MTDTTEFRTELEALVDRQINAGADIADVATEMQRYLNAFVGQHNLEYELQLKGGPI